MKTSKYEVFTDKLGRWRYRLRAANGEIVGGGESYTRKSGALRGVEAHRRAAWTAVIVVL